MQRIESSTASGIPDLYFMGGGIGGWAELKAMEETPSGRYNLSLKRYTLLQREWLAKHARNGGNSLLCVGIGRAIFWLRPPEALNIVKFTMDEIKERAVAIGPRLPL